MTHTKTRYFDDHGLLIREIDHLNNIEKRVEYTRDNLNRIICEKRFTNNELFKETNYNYYGNTDIKEYSEVLTYLSGLKESPFVKTHYFENGYIKDQEYSGLGGVFEYDYKEDENGYIHVLYKNHVPDPLEERVFTLNEKGQKIYELIHESEYWDKDVNDGSFVRVKDVEKFFYYDNDDRLIMIEVPTVGLKYIYRYEIDGQLILHEIYKNEELEYRTRTTIISDTERDIMIYDKSNDTISKDKIIRYGNRSEIYSYDFDEINPKKETK